jgi:REP element-mobilizing transposase RayT
MSESACRIVTDSLNFCREHKGLQVNAYVSMPTHLHGIVFLRQFEPAALKSTLTDLRKFTGRRLIEYCAERMPGCFNEQFVRAAGQDRDRRFWQPTLHPEQIATEAFYTQKLDYMHDNPRRKGLVRRAEYLAIFIGFVLAVWWKGGQ